MMLMKMLPGVLKELAKHVPTVLFQVVEWSDLAYEIPKLSKRLMQKEDYQSFFDAQKVFLEPYHVFLRQEELVPEKEKIDRWAAEKILELFYLQLHSPHGLFLDLRYANFDPSVPNLNWHPTGLFTTFAPEFRAGLIDVYDGFYLEDEARFQQGLALIGLTSQEWSQEDKTHLGELFKAQFGSSLKGEMTFKLDEFKDAMLKTSDFLLVKKVKITKDFLYLGIYLVTLYSTLEDSQQGLEAKQAYLRVRKFFS